MRGAGGEWILTMKEDWTMIFFPNQTVAHPQDVRDRVMEEVGRQAGAVAWPEAAERPSLDVVDLSSRDSFPASDPPPWTLGYPDRFGAECDL
jgi:hypothetical protein